MTAQPAPAPVGWRLPALATAALALLAGMYAGLLLAGVPLPAPATPVEQVHGPLLVFGFVGTLIALERAVALGARWALLAPICSGAGGAALLLDVPAVAGKTLLMLASVLLLATYRALWRRQPAVAVLVQAGGAFAWYAATLLWLAGFPVAEFVVWLVTFVVLTIAGERLELAHVGLRHGHAERWLLAALVTLTVAATAAMVWPGPGTQAYGAALLTVAAWLVTFDVARHTVRGGGLPRYVAVGLLAGYGWLALAGLLWAGAGPATDGPRYDATLHAVFLGFVLSMIFVHAPVILPAVLRVPLPYHPVFHVPLALLHGSLLVRLVAGDAAGIEAVWRWAAVANVTAVLAFAGCAVAVSLARPRRGSRASTPGVAAGRVAAVSASGSGPAAARPVSRGVAP